MVLRVVLFILALNLWKVLLEETSSTRPTGSHSDSSEQGT